MHPILAIVLSIAFLSFHWRDAVVCISFKINQKYIAEECCINRFSPGLGCQGSCYLRAHLMKNKEQGSSKNLILPISSADFTIYFEDNFAEKILSCPPKRERKPFFGYHSPLPGYFMPGLFRPPIVA